MAANLASKKLSIWGINLIVSSKWECKKTIKHRFGPFWGTVFQNVKVDADCHMQGCIYLTGQGAPPIKKIRPDKVNSVSGLHNF